jgi:putative intracellular protease/amidase
MDKADRKNEMKQWRWAARAATILICGSSLGAHAGALDASNPKATYVCQMTPGPVVEYAKPGYCHTDGMELLKKTTLRVAVLVFDGAEIIDFAGPMEVFSAAGAKVFTVAPTTAAVLAGDSLRIQPDYDIDHAPEADILVIPGGNPGSVTDDERVMDWIRQRSASPGTLMSVCTGAFILGQAGLLDGRSATVTATALSGFAKAFPKTLVVRDRRFVDAGNIVTTAGLSAGIDGALHMLEREQGALRARDIARYLEYDWQPERSATAGRLARLKLPPLSDVFPSEVSWERQSDAGNSEHWEIGGRLELSTSADAYLDAVARRIAQKGWGPSAPTAERVAAQGRGRELGRRFGKQDADGYWTLTLALMGEPAPSSDYRMQMTLRKTAPTAPHAGERARKSRP